MGRYITLKSAFTPEAWVAFQTFRQTRKQPAAAVLQEWLQHSKGAAVCSPVGSDCFNMAGATCTSRVRSLTPYQQTVNLAVETGSPHSLLVWHEAGTGKTCAMAAAVSAHIRRQTYRVPDTWQEADLPDTYRLVQQSVHPTGRCLVVLPTDGAVPLLSPTYEPIPHHVVAVAPGKLKAQLREHIDQQMCGKLFTPSSGMRAAIQAARQEWQTAKAAAHGQDATDEQKQTEQHARLKLRAAQSFANLPVTTLSYPEFANRVIGLMPTLPDPTVVSTKPACSQWDNFESFLDGGCLDVTHPGLLLIMDEAHNLTRFHSKAEEEDAADVPDAPAATGESDQGKKLRWTYEYLRAKATCRMLLFTATPIVRENYEMYRLLELTQQDLRFSPSQLQLTGQDNAMRKLLGIPVMSASTAPTALPSRLNVTFYSREGDPRFAQVQEPTKHFHLVPVRLPPAMSALATSSKAREWYTSLHTVGAPIPNPHQLLYGDKVKELIRRGYGQWVVQKTPGGTESKVAGVHKFLAHRTVQDPLLMSDRPGAQAAMLVLLEQMAPKVAALQRRLATHATERHFVLNALQPQYAFRTVVAMLQCFQYPFEILDATLKEEEQRAALERFNRGSARILVATVQYREGISLKNVNHVHLMEVQPTLTDTYQAISRAIRLCSHHDDKIRAKGVTVHTYVAVNDQQDVLGQEAVHILQSLKGLRETQMLLHDVKTRALDAELYGKDPPAPPSVPDAVQSGDQVVEGVHVSAAIQSTRKKRKKRAASPETRSPEEQLRRDVLNPRFRNYKESRKKLHALLKNRQLPLDDFSKTGKKWLKYITQKDKNRKKYVRKLQSKYDFLAVSAAPGITESVEGGRNA